jgi:hypothetical protein
MTCKSKAHQDGKGQIILNRKICCVSTNTAIKKQTPQKQPTVVVSCYGETVRKKNMKTKAINIQRLAVYRLPSFV